MVLTKLLGDWWVLRPGGGWEVVGQLSRVAPYALPLGGEAGAAPGDVRLPAPSHDRGNGETEVLTRGGVIIFLERSPRPN